MDALGAAEPATVRLAIPPEPRLLATVRLVVGVVARKAGMDEEGIEDLKLAVSETCAFAVGDLNRAGRPDPIEIHLVEAADRFRVEIRDRAPASGRPAGDADPDGEVADRRFALALVGALVDDLQTATLEDGDHWTSFWIRRGSDPRPTAEPGSSPPDPLSTGGPGSSPPDPLPPPLT